MSSVTRAKLDEVSSLGPPMVDFEHLGYARKRFRDAVFAGRFRCLTAKNASMP